MKNLHTRAAQWVTVFGIAAVLAAAEECGLRMMSKGAGAPAGG